MQISTFTYYAYIKMLESLLCNGYFFASYHNCEQFARPCIMRHDIDLDVKAALRLAKLESGFSKKVKSTFFVLVNTTFYNVFSKEILDDLDAILSLGHEIGLHFDEAKYDCSTFEKIDNAVQEEANMLGRVLGISINTVSMHRPSKVALEANYNFRGIINTYSDKYYGEFKYLSDSRMHWRENAEEIITSRIYDKLHILTHAFWYADTEESKREKLLRFTKNASYERYDSLIDNFTSLKDVIAREEI
jgi:hypothetical protein